MQFMLMCRSLTYAQRTARVLERAGVTAGVERAPKSVSNRGCADTVLVPERPGERALEILAGAGLSPERVLIKKPDGTITERDGGHDIS